MKNPEGNIITVETNFTFCIAKYFHCHNNNYTSRSCASWSKKLSQNKNSPLIYPYLTSLWLHWLPSSTVCSYAPVAPNLITFERALCQQEDKLLGSGCRPPWQALRIWNPKTISPVLFLSKFNYISTESTVKTQRDIMAELWLENTWVLKVNNQRKLEKELRNYNELLQ